MFRRKPADSTIPESKGTADTALSDRAPHQHHLPQHHVHRLPHGIHRDGESGRKGIHPFHFFRIVFRSSSRVSAAVNILFPFVPAAIAMYFARPDDYMKIFILNYIAMVPSANLLGFAGQELAHKLPKVFGMLLETFLGSIVEIVLFMVLIREDGMMQVKTGVPISLIPVIQSAILGSILANLLLCLGACFVAGGIRHETQKFDSAISEVGTGLLLMAAFGLAIPRAFLTSLETALPGDAVQQTDLTLKVSRAAAILLLVAFAIYVFFQMRSHHNLYESVFEADELQDRDRHKDLAKAKLTLTESLIAIVLALALVSMHAVFLVEQIQPIITNRHVSDLFMGLILVPLVEKIAEHLTAVDEAWDNQMNFALAHVLGATLQTALLNSSLVVLVGWGLGKNMSLDFASYQVILLVLAILTVGNFLRDQESNYLEGSLCILIYLLIAVTSFYYPNQPERAADGVNVNGTDAAAGGALASATEGVVQATASVVARLLL